MHVNSRKIVLVFQKNKIIEDSYQLLKLPCNLSRQKMHLDFEGYVGIVLPRKIN